MVVYASYGTIYAQYIDSFSYVKEEYELSAYTQGIQALNKVLGLDLNHCSV